MVFSFYLDSSGRHDSNATALAAAQAVGRCGHEIYRIFFFADACLQATGEQAQCWAELARHSGCDLCVCSASAVAAGISIPNYPASSAQRHELHPKFSVGGLVQLVEASQVSDRTVQLHLG